MDPNDREFHARRVEQEARLALEATTPQAVRAHTQLAALHSEKTKADEPEPEIDWPRAAGRDG